MNYSNYGYGARQDAYFDPSFPSGNQYDIDPYYADEITNSSPSPPERSQAPRYEPEDINEYDDDGALYYEDDPIHYPSTDSFQQAQEYDNHLLDAHRDTGFNTTQFQNAYRDFSSASHNFPASTFRAQPPPQQSAQHQRHAQMDAGLRGVPFHGSNPRNSSGIRLRPVSELPDVYRGIFKFGVFNAVQSSCFPAVTDSDENMIISAPTGGGKTVLFELAIIRMLKQARETGGSPKCVYIAPTKALCSERQRDWTAKFSILGIKCCELTGDTVQFGKGVWGDAKSATIIITTGEKWDSLTRNWADHGHILSQIQLFLVDEVHILNETRGSTLEVVVSRMKSRGSAVRFVLVSATVPNIQDIASWIGNKRRDGPALVFQFGEEFRPCKLTRHVIGISRQRHENDFSFARKLDFKVFPALQTHSVGKPILIFVSTRKGVLTTANQLMKEYKEAEIARKPLPWTHPNRIDHVFHEKNLTELAHFGIGIHHAGLTMDDRRAVEDLYLKGVLRVVVATSTLAVGVNLPAHTVVIKGVQIFQNNASVEYSDLDVMQMLGRAGRPQFDKDGMAIILCESELEKKYRELVQGKTVVESSLHTNLFEHINSEIGLGTITDVRSAKEWLRGSYLFQRIKKNPAHYSLGKGENQSWEERVDDMVMQSIEKLRETKLIEGATPGDAKGRLTSTEFGDIMSKFYIRQSTMSLILALPERPSLRDILEMISSAEELAETKLRTSEKTVFNKLRKHNDIRFQVKKVEKTSDKVFLLIQAVLSGISLNAPDYKSADSQLHLEAFSVFKHIARIARVVVEVAIVQKRGAQLKYGLELVRCLTAKAWEDRPVVLKQIESIGEKSIKVLAENGITSLTLLAKQEPYKIEALLNRRPPFGNEVLASLKEFPQYILAIQEVEIHTNGGKDPVEIDLTITCGLGQDIGNGSKVKKQKGRTQMTAILTLTSDSELIDFRRISTKALKESKTFEVTAELTKPSQSVVVMITSESLAGLTIVETYKPQIPSKEYPTRDTRPPTAIDLDLEDMDQYSDYWNMPVDEYGNELLSPPPVVKDPVVRDLTKPRAIAKKNQPPQATDAHKVPDSPPQPKKLPNGNYSCNHSCKDKTKCRHMCCRDGLTEPPKQPKRTTAPITEPQNDSTVTTSSSQPKKPKKTTHRPESTLQDLEKLHERSNVSLKLDKANRLKLEPAELKRKRKPVIGFNMELSQLNDGEITSSYAFEDLKDDDDLPEPHEILRAADTNVIRREPSPETTYSDSEIDSLIRHAPSDFMQDATKTTAPASIKPSKHTSKKDVPNALPYTPVSSRKRNKKSSEENLPPPKKSRVDAGIILDLSSSPPLHDNGRKEPLFSNSHSGASEQDNFDVRVHDQPHAVVDDFTLDCDILPPTPALTASDDEFKTTSEITHLVPTPEQARSTMDVGVKKGKGAEDIVMQDSGNDDLAEFDAWLNSGAVEIIPD